MKKMVIGCCFTAIGSISSIALFIAISFHMNQLGGGSFPQGKFAFSLEHTGASILVMPLILSIVMLIWGLVYLYTDWVEAFNKFINQ